jgi:TolB-like protein/tRNA A-37 threonylcarbamoyl transferase component Bud32/Flp pilus assembly protein TadD
VAGNLQFEEALRDRYVLERELGRGGMATVYLARDLKHDRLVALKVIRPELAATLGPARFLREIKLAARLQHPHILSVHDSGEAAGQLWFTMPYVDGESLRDRLERDGPLPLDDAVQITREAAQALDYAHQQGVIHRDIKPENILLTQDGNVLVGDFGIARMFGAEEPLTATGLSLGTPAYMSPEQAAGERIVDARSDVYSLATVVYEMLAGEPPFTGATAQAIIAKRFSTPATPVRVLRADVPEHIEQALTTALARTPAGRFRGTGDFAAALKTSTRTPKPDTRRIASFAALAIGLLLLAAGAWTFLESRKVRPHATPGSPGITRLAVLPFDNLGDSADAYFADGVSDEIRGKLAALSGLEVIARASSSQYRRTPKPPRQIGQELQVRYLLTGTVRWEKHAGQNRVRVSPELVDAGSGAARWQAPFDASITDVFQVQGEIAGRVAEALHVALGAGEEQLLSARPTANVAAYDAFLRGEAATRQFNSIDVAALRRGLVFYDQAVRLDSSFAVAWARISRAHSFLYFASSSDPADSAAADQAVRRARALAPRLSDVQLALGEYYYRIVGDNARALAEYRKGRELTPNDANLIGASSVAEQSLGRWDEAVSDARQAFRLDPRSVRSSIRLARALIFVRHYDEALEAANAGTAIDPTSPDALWMNVVAHAAKGDRAGIRSTFRSAPPELNRAEMAAYFAHYWELAWTLDPGDLDLLTRLSPDAFGGVRSDWGLALTQAWALKGDTSKARIYADSARLAFESMVRQSPHGDQNFALLGLSLAYLGRYDQAISAAKRALAIRNPGRDPYNGGYNLLQLARVYAIAGQRENAITTLEDLLKIPLFVTPGWLRIDPTFSSLMSDPRFQRLATDTTQP